MQLLPYWPEVVVVLTMPSLASFISTAIDRLPRHEPIVWSRSNCVSCKKTLTARDLIPIISYSVLGGRCRFCNAPIPFRYFLGELSALCISVASIANIGVVNFVGSLPLALPLFALACFDLKNGSLPDWLTLPLCAFGLLIAPCQLGSPLDHFIGAIAGFAVAASIAFGYRLLRKRDGLGGGDIKLLAAAGAWIGLKFLFVIMAIASFSALVFALITSRPSRHSAIPFGPFIAAATWAVWCWQIAMAGDIR